MNFIKNILIKISFLLSIFFLLSCENDELKDEAVTAKNRTFPDISSFLENEYPSGYSFGDSREFNSNGNTFVVKEVFKSSSSQVNAFVNITEGDFTHFLELDRSKDLLLIEDFEDQATYQLTPNNNTIFEPGFLVGIDEPEVETFRFWGWQCGSEYSIGNSTYRNCCYYTIWIRNGRSCDVFSTDNLPGSNPVLK